MWSADLKKDSFRTYSWHVIILILEQKLLSVTGTIINKNILPGYFPGKYE